MKKRGVEFTVEDTSFYTDDGDIKESTRQRQYYSVRKYQRGKSFIRTYERYEGKYKLIDSRRGRGYASVIKEARAGKIFPSIDRTFLFSHEGKMLYEYLSTRPPRRTTKNVSGKHDYKISFVGYFYARKIRGGRTIIVMGISSGYLPGDRRPPRQRMAEDAYNNAFKVATAKLNSSSITLSLIKGGYRYFGAVG